MSCFFEIMPSFPKSLSDGQDLLILFWFVVQDLLILFCQVILQENKVQGYKTCARPCHCETTSPNVVLDTSVFLINGKVGSR